MMRLLNGEGRTGKTGRARPGGPWRLWLLLCLLALAGCRLGQDGPPGAVVPPPPVAAPSAIIATPTPGPQDTGWVAVGPGLEMRRMSERDGMHQIPAVVLRADPSLVEFRVAYAPDHPQTMTEWCNQPGVRAAINGGFFDVDYRATGLVISDGLVSGNSYEGVGGMFAVGAQGDVTLRYLGEQPYWPGEPLVEALQGWPMLVKGGGVVAYENPDDMEHARRSILAMDRSGRVLLIAFPTSAYSLSELPDWLRESDLDIDAALNLDGGSSTALCLKQGEEREVIEAFTPLPLVLMIR